MKSVLGIACRDLRFGIRALPAYGSIEMRPIIHASAPNVRAVRSYSENTRCGSFHAAVTMRPSIEGAM
jgi:hypothetical protein